MHTISHTKHKPSILFLLQDKYENEDLIKYGLPEDVWFHVDDLSSAHVYLRMKPGMYGLLSWFNVGLGTVLLQFCFRMEFVLQG